MKNTGKPYEVLTEKVFARLLHETDVCVNLERDVVLLGRATKHQIDVTFEFVVGSVSYRTIVECKDWGVAVKQEQVLAFYSVLLDIPGQPRGIIVSRSGFQEGARTVAAHRGIALYELREPRDEDWEGLIRTIVINMNIRAPHFDGVRLLLDEPWAREEAKRRGLSGFKVESSVDPEGGVVFESGAPCDLNGILQGYVPVDGCGPVSVRHTFTERAFVELFDCPLSRLAVLGIEAMITIHEDNREIRVSLDHLIAYCFRDVLTGEVRFLGRDGGQV